MSSSSLISLFRDNGLTRSNSVQKTFICPPMLSKSQSQSKLYSKSASQQTHKYAPLCRAFYLLQKKMVQLNYFFFCRLERIYKNKSIKMIGNSSQEIEQSTSQNNNKNFIQQYEKGVEKLSVSLQILETKYNFSYKLQVSFSKIVKTAKKSKSLQIFAKFKTKTIRKIQKDFFVKFMSFHCMHLKFEFFVFGINSILQNRCKRIALEYIKNSQRTQQSMSLLIPTTPNIHQESLQYSEDSIFRQNNFQIVDKKSYIHQNKPRIQITMSKKSERMISDIETKTRIQQPRRIPNISKALGKKPKMIQNDIIPSNFWSQSALEEKVNIIHKIHPEIKTNQIPDINDNKVFGNNRPSFLDRIAEQMNYALSTQRQTNSQFDNYSHRSFYKKLPSQSRFDCASIIQWSSKTSSKLRQEAFSESIFKFPPSQVSSIDESWKNRSRFEKVSGMIQEIDRVQQKSMLLSMSHIPNISDRSKLVVHLNRKNKLDKSSSLSSPSHFSKSMKNFSIISKNSKTSAYAGNKENIKQKTQKGSKQKKIKQMKIISHGFKKKERDTFDEYFGDFNRGTTQYYTKQTQISPEKNLFKNADI